MSSSAELKIPFSEFFEKYFKDESGRYPESVEGRVWFDGSYSTEDIFKLGDKKYKIREQTDYMIDIGWPEMIIDCSVFKNLKEGFFVYLEGDHTYRVMMKRSSEDWKTIKEFKKARFDKSDNYLIINGYRVLVLGKASKFYAERLADCINAYLKQNEETKEEVTFNSELVTGALDNIDERINEIKEKLATLQASEEEAS